MKAHINQQAARPLALLYGLPESTETGRGVRAALEEQGFSSKEIAPEQLLQPVGALAGLGGKAAPLYSGEAPDAQLLLMSNFTSPQLNAVLDALRESRCDEAQQDMERAGTAGRAAARARSHAPF